jgi:uncharacterized Tic20 family protein
MMALVLRLAPLCDWHHGRSHGGSLDPQSEAIVTAILGTLFLLLGVTLFLVVAGGPLLVIWTRKVRHLFWSIPAVNAAIYSIALAGRPYPGGFAAQFRLPGLFYTILELILVMLLSLAAAGILAIVFLLLRLTKRVFRTATAHGDRPPMEVAATPSSQQAHPKDDAQLRADARLPH